MQIPVCSVLMTCLCNISTNFLFSSNKVIYVQLTSQLTSSSDQIQQSYNTKIYNQLSWESSESISPSGIRCFTNFAISSFNLA